MKYIFLKADYYRNLIRAEAAYTIGSVIDLSLLGLDNRTLIILQRLIHFIYGGSVDFVLQFPLLQLESFSKIAIDQFIRYIVVPLAKPLQAH